jgi:hypothetical protein
LLVPIPVLAAAAAAPSIGELSLAMDAPHGWLVEERREVPIEQRQ